MVSISGCKFQTAARSIHRGEILDDISCVQPDARWPVAARPGFEGVSVRVLAHHSAMSPQDRQASLIGWTHLVYALHAFSIVIGILGAASVIGSFLIGWPSLLAVVLNYVKRSEARGTWLESHFRWQIRTFWFGLLWATLCGVLLLFTLFLAIIILWLPLAVLTLWFIYRVVRGWRALAASQPMYG
jgi:uncharacterized membrane protein